MGEVWRCTGKGEPGTIDENVTIPSLDEVRLESPNEPKKEASEDLIAGTGKRCNKTSYGRWFESVCHGQKM